MCRPAVREDRLEIAVAAIDVVSVSAIARELRLPEQNRGAGYARVF